MQSVLLDALENLKQALKETWILRIIHEKIKIVML